MSISDKIKGLFVYEYDFPACVFLLILSPVWASALLMLIAVFKIADYIQNRTRKAR